MKKINVATIFSGIGAPEWALKRLNLQHKILLACDNGEIDISSFVSDEEKDRALRYKNFYSAKKYVDHLYKKYSRKTNYVKKTYLSNYPDFCEKNYFQDVTLLNGTPFYGKIDLLVGGSPCQSFSTVGYQNGLSDVRGNLFFEYVRIAKQIQPKVFVYENVSGIRSRKNKDNWEKMKKKIQLDGYQIKEFILNSKDFGIPQVRNRVFIVGFKNTTIDLNNFEPKKRKPYGFLKDFLLTSTEDGGFSYDKKTGDLLFSRVPGKIDSKYILSEAVKKYVTTPGTKNWKTNISYDREIARTLLSTMGNHHRAGVDNYVTDVGSLRALSERECLRLMGFTDDFKIVVSKAQMYKQVGNSMVVDVVMALIEAILKTGIFNS